MSTYELDDELVRAYLAQPLSSRSDAEAAIAQALQAQLPQLLPTKLGATVQTKDGRFWVVIEPDDSTPWRCPDGSWADSADLHRWGVGRVLSEGVDL